jgi:hypothetical protein
MPAFRAASAACLLRRPKELEQWLLRSLTLVSREISIPLRPDPRFLSSNAFALDSSVFTIKVLCCTAPMAICLTFWSAFGLPHLVRPSADSGFSVLLFLAARHLFPCALILVLSVGAGGTAWLLLISRVFVVFPHTIIRVIRVLHHGVGAPRVSVRK